jgi:hypothetical protein
VANARAALAPEPPRRHHPFQNRGQLDDGDRARVAGQDHLGPGDLVEPAEHLALCFLVLGRGFNDEIAIGQIVDGRARGDPGQLLRSPLLVEFPRSTARRMLASILLRSPRRCPRPMTPHPTTPTFRTSSAFIAVLPPVEC